MKRLVSLFLALVFSAILCAPAFASENGDIEKRITKIVIYDRGDLKYEYTFDYEGNRLEPSHYLTYVPDAGGGYSDSSDTYNTFDEHGNLIKSEQAILQYTLTSEYEYTYDGDKVVEMKTADNTGEVYGYGSSVTDKTYLYAYDGDTLASTTYQRLDDGVQRETITEHQYDQDGKLIEEEVYEDGSLSSTKRYEYNEDGTTTVIILVDNAESSRNNCVYTKDGIEVDWEDEMMTVDMKGVLGQEMFSSVLSRWAYTGAPAIESPEFIFDADGYLTKIDVDDTSYFELTYEEVN